MAAAVEGFGVRRRYARAQLEALKGAPSTEAQVRRWAEVYAALAAAGFSGEYDGLLSGGEPMNRKGKKTNKNSRGGFSWGGSRNPDAVAPRFTATDVTEVPAWRDEEAQELGVHRQHYVEAVHGPNGVHQVTGEPFDQGVGYEEDSDDDDYGILKPAFVVDGDPDFESGEPLDGFEYLRRVRWEANQIPGVKVAKVDLTTARHEQTPYMPEIPNIPHCSRDLCSSKDWEDMFMNYFLQTRLAFSKLESIDGPYLPAGQKKSKLHGNSELQKEPTVTMLLSMDAVSRGATLRNYIDMIQSLDTLSRNDCLWLFALCVAVDTPLDAATCASMRSLLRKCATILTTKSEVDDEVVMLNILIAISGRYFGQYENR